MREPNFEELENGIKINADALDEELCQHIENYHLVSKGYKLALQERDRLKKEIKSKAADLQFEARDTLTEMDYGRVTESLVLAQIERDKNYVNLTEQLLEAEVDLGKWEALKLVYEQRSYALNKLVDLQISGYMGVAPVYSAREESSLAKEERNQKVAGKASEEKLVEQTKDGSEPTKPVTSVRKRLSNLRRKTEEK